MMANVLALIPVLAIMMIINVATGVYHKIGIEKIAFDWKIFINGIIKSLIVFGALIGLAYCCDAVDFLELENTPIIMLKSVIVGYGAKVSVTLYNILRGNVSDTPEEVMNYGNY